MVTRRQTLYVTDLDIRVEFGLPHYNESAYTSFSSLTRLPLLLAFYYCPVADFIKVIPGPAT